MKKSKTFKKKLQIDTGDKIADETDVNVTQEIEIEDPVIITIREYMEGELKEKDDLSYDWINKDTNIQFLNKCIKTDLINMKTTIEKRDTNCELKVDL
jgi:hypothetical protein